MPQFTTHYLFGETVEKQLPADIENMIKKEHSAYFWGLQGPDILFYSEIIRTRGCLLKIGVAMHYADPEAIFSIMLNYISVRKDTSEYDCLCAYLYGFVCHYALDANAHPFVYSFQQKMHKGPRYGRHALIESRIDSLMYRQLKDEPISTFKIKSLYKKYEPFMMCVSKMYVEIIKQVLGKTVAAKQLVNGFSSCLRVNSVFYGITGVIAGWLVKLPEFVCGRTGIISSFTRFDHINSDTLNLKHEVWHNLCDPDICYKLSFPEIFDISRNEAVSLIGKCSEILSSGDSKRLGLTRPFDYGSPSIVNLHKTIPG